MEGVNTKYELTFRIAASRINGMRDGKEFAEWPMD